MSNTLVMGKKAFTWTVVVATIAWAMSAAFIAIPLASAATLTAGDLIVGTAKSTSGPGRPVYFYGSDGKKYLFPSSKTYAAWYGTSFSAVKELTQAEVDAVVSGDKNVTAKPGSCVSFVNDSAVYVVDGTSRRATDATTCPAASTHSIPEGFRANYSSGAAWSGDKAALASAANLGTTLGLSATAAPAPAATGALTAALASDNPAASVVPGGASSVVLLKFNVTAGSTAQTVTGLGIKAVGVGAVADLSAVYVYDGATRLTSGRTLGSQTKATEFSGLNLSVAANSTKTLAIVADIATAQVSGDTHALQVTSLATTASVAGLPLTGNTMSMGSQDVSVVQVRNGSTPANPTIGQKGVAISEFRLDAGVNDAEVRRVTVTVGGTSSMSDLTNFTLHQAGTKLADGTIASDRVTFDLATPYVIAQGTQRLFTIKADTGGRSTRTIITYIDSTYPTDLLATDKLYGYGATVNFGTDTTCDATDFCSATTGITVTLQGGKTTVAFNGPPAADVAVGSQDTQFMKFSLTAADQALEVRRLVMSLDSTGAAGEMSDDDSGTQVNFFTDVKIKNADTGAVVMGPLEITATGDVTAAQTFTFTDSWTLDAGKTVNLIATADIRNTSDTDLVGFGYQMTLTQFNASSIREISTGQFLAITDIVPNPAAGVAGNTMTVRASALTVQLASTPISGTTVRGSTGVQMVGFSFAAGVQSDIKVTQIVMTGQGDDTGGTYTVGELDDVVISAQLYDGATAVSAAKSPTTAGVLTFDNLTWTIPAGSTKKLVAKVSLATTLMAAATDTAWLGIGAAADITATDKDSNTVTATDGDATWSNPINSAPTVVLTVNNAGTLTVARDGDSALSTIILGGTNDVSLLKVRFTAANEPFLLKRLRVANEGTGSTAVTCDGTETTPENASNCDTGVAQIKMKYPKKDGTTGTKTGVLSSGLADFSDLDGYLALDKSAVVEVLADLTTITESGISGDQIRLGLDLDSNFEVVGEGSGSSVTTCAGVTAGANLTCVTAATDTSGVDLNGNAATVRKAKPTVTLHAASPSGGASKQSDVEVLRFTVAASGGEVELGRLTFQTSFTSNSTTAGPATWNEPATQSGAVLCNTSGACTDTANSFDASNIRIYDVDDPNTQLTGIWQLYDSGGLGLASGEEVGFAKFDFATARTVTTAAPKTYAVRLDVVGLAPASDDSISLSVVGDTSATFAAGTTILRGNSVVYGEVSSGATALTIASGAPTAGITGILVKNLPVTGGTLVY